MPFPAVVLLASGGHTLLAAMGSDWDYRLLGTTRDDSVGECYDKVARTLGFGMPGGPAIDRAAREGVPEFRLPRPMKAEGFEFSFSGLKSAVARRMETHPDTGAADMSASFVEAVLDVLVTKVDRALAQEAPKALVIVGGVAASPVSTPPACPRGI